MKLLVLSLMVCAAVASCPYQCDLSWSKYNGRLFKLFTNPSTWVEAQKHCVSLGGSLASIHIGAENEFVKNLSGSTKAWIGLNDAPQEGEWAWINSNQVDYINWCRGEPSNWRGNEHCVILAGTCWSDRKCSTLLPYVCVRKNIKSLT
ncbi:C-type lectin BfL-2-like [Eucyclogobius newberryi]|uniref:C-type lectin BfL-2-like n=1 Tax=Eucyclogobius newberryi TaxID=166745 RepID=UPI003B5CD1F6